MNTKLYTHIEELNELEKHRKKWLVLSAFVFAVVSFLIFDWFFIDNQRVLWTIGALGLLVSMVWWYWTMRLIRILIGHRFAEIEILNDLYQDIKSIRKDLERNLNDRDLTE